MIVLYIFIRVFSFKSFQKKKCEKVQREEVWKMKNCLLTYIEKPPKQYHRLVTSFILPALIRYDLAQRQHILKHVNHCFHPAILSQAARLWFPIVAGIYVWLPIHIVCKWIWCLCVLVCLGNILKLWCLCRHWSLEERRRRNYKFGENLNQSQLKYFFYVFIHLKSIISIPSSIVCLFFLSSEYNISGSRGFGILSRVTET